MGALAAFLAKVLWLGVDVLIELVVTHTRRDRRVNLASSPLAPASGRQRRTDISYHATRCPWRSIREAVVFETHVPGQLNWPLMNRRELKSLSVKVDRPVKILSFCLWHILVVFARHYLEIFLEELLDSLSDDPFLRGWVHRLSSLPIVPTKG